MRFRSIFLKVLLVLGINLSLFAQTQIDNSIFQEDFSNGFDRWKLFGSPQSKIVDLIDGKKNVFDNNGDDWCSSGAVSKQKVNLSDGGTIEADIYLKVSDYSGCWVEGAFGLSNGKEISSGDCANDGYHSKILGEIVMIGDACWASSENERRHIYISGSDFNKVKDDTLANGWHKLKTVIDNNGYYTVYVDGKYIGKSNKAISKEYLNGYLYLGNRSSNNGGKAYIDNLKVYSSSSQNKDANSPDVSNLFLKYSKATKTTGFEIADINGDNLNELVLSNNKNIEIYKYVNDKLVLLASKTFDNAPRSIVVADVDNDGKKEIIVGTGDGDSGGYVYVLGINNNTFATKWTSPKISSIRYANELAVGDINHNGKKEIIVGISWYSRKLVSYEYNDGSYKLLLQDNIGSDTNSVAIGDIDGDGKDDLGVGTGCWSDYGTRIYQNNVLKDKITGKGMTHIKLLDIDGDGKDEIIAGVGTKCGGSSTPRPVVKIYKYLNNSLTQIKVSSEFSKANDLHVFIDSNKIGNKNYIAAISSKVSDNHIILYDTDLKEIWKYDINETGRNIKIKDIDNDGINDLLVSTDNKFYVFSAKTKNNINLSKDLVAYYQFEGNAKDSSGNGNDGVEHGGVTYADGVIGKAASFDGVDDYVDTDGNMPSDATDGYYLTYVAWIKVENCKTDKFIPIIWDDDWQSGGDRGISLTTMDNQCKFSIFRKNDGFGDMYSNENIKLNQWYFVAFVLNGKSNKVIYINGKKDNFSNIEYTFNHNGRTRIAIGSGHDGYVDHFNGLIDDVRIYNRALSEDEIKALYNLGANKTTNSNKLHLKQDWNLISANISDLLSIPLDAEILWKYKDGKWSAYSNNSIIKNKLINKIPTFNSLKNSEGFWVYAGRGFDLNVLPNEKTSTTSYKKGWQLAGVGDDTKTSILQCENAKVRSIWKYKDGKWLLKTDVPNTLNLETFDTIKANEGFWIECAENEEQTNTDDQNNNQTNSQTGVVWLLVKSVGGSGDWDFNYEYSDTNGVKDLKLTSQYADVEMSVSSTGYEFKVDGYARNPIKISLNSPTDFCASGNDWYIKTANNHQCDLQQSNIYVGKWSGESKLWLNDDPNTYCTWRWDVTIDSNNKGTISSSLIAHNNDQGYCASNGYATFHMEDITGNGFNGVVDSSDTSLFGGRNQMYMRYSNSQLTNTTSLNIEGYPATNQVTLHKSN